jgi:protein disulfide-isomerase A1
VFLRNLVLSVDLLQLDEAALVLAELSEPIVVAKVNADKYWKLGSRYGVE